MLFGYSTRGISWAKRTLFCYGDRCLSWHWTGFTALRLTLQVQLNGGGRYLACCSTSISMKSTLLVNSATTTQHNTIEILNFILSFVQVAFNYQRKSDLVVLPSGSSSCGMPSSVSANVKASCRFSRLALFRTRSMSTRLGRRAKMTVKKATPVRQLEPKSFTSMPNCLAGRRKRFSHCLTFCNREYGNGLIDEDTSSNIYE